MVKIIGAAIGEGAVEAGGRAGPDWLRVEGLAQEIKRKLNGGRFNEIDWASIVYQGRSASGIKERMTVVENFCENLEQVVGAVMLGGHFPATIGGDHSCAVGTWSAIARVKQAELGMLWLDAHLDSHTLETSPSKAAHGMPLACLLGHGSERLINCGGEGRKLNPERTVVVGVRSYEKSERELLDRLGVRIYEMTEINRRGLEEVMEEAIGIVGGGYYGVSVDMDVFDPLEVPSVGSPVNGGIGVNDVVEIIKNLKISEDNFLAGIEICEYSPERDHENKGFQAVVNVLGGLCGSN